MWTLSAVKIIDEEENITKKKSEFELPKIEVIMFSVSSEVQTGLILTPSGKWEEEDDWIDPEDNIY
ncbi:hypothetical protein [Eubacterium sp.]|uniref:hypothetical protein n=1 Tax=Eubacterium sp. TaxID=142586 RepID=UPI0025B7AE66|nr:hypothetical protein [Eubacterium sp.]MCI7800362.1 hypothetical protein [Eubacterium sp.]